jgi:hypothetical protein
MESPFNRKLKRLGSKAACAEQPTLRKNRCQKTRGEEVRMNASPEISGWSRWKKICYETRTAQAGSRLSAPGKTFVIPTRERSETGGICCSTREDEKQIPHRRFTPVRNDIVAVG